MSQSAAAKQQLQDAFALFNEVSEQLTGSYLAIQNQVISLSGELAAARSERLRQLAEKEKLADQLATLLDALPGGVVVLDQQQRIQEANPAAQELLSVPLTGRHWDEVVASIKAAHQPGSHEFQLRNGHFISIRRRELSSNQGQILLLQDVTETRSLQQQVARVQRLSAMGEMTARLAHQIRTPLSTALLYASQLQQTQLRREQHDCFVERLLVGLRHLDHMVNDMLVFARGGEGGAETVSLRELLNQVYQSILPQLSELDAHWSVDCTEQDIFIRGQRALLASALTNLVSNALQAGGAGVRVHWRLQVQQGMVCIHLQDNGPGIAPELYDQLFEPFFTTRCNGTGLGLAVVRAVITAHRGNIEIDSEYHDGARFVLQLPLLEANQLLPSERLQKRQKASIADPRYV